MSVSDVFPLSLDHLPCACLRTSRSGEIVFFNEYFLRHYNWAPENLNGNSISSILSRASQIFCNSFVYPKALAEPVCPEVQLTVLTSAGERRPVVANVNRLPDGGFAWILVEATNRNNLFLELESARKTLEKQKELLQKLARTDPLTGVLNRRAFDDEIERMFAEADRHGHAVSVLLMDIDHFKSINDTHGHQIGDQALTSLGSMLKAVCRGQDVVARFGGDEFVCLLPFTKVEAAFVLCERIHAAAAEIMVDLCPYTVSIGVAGRTGKQSVDCADVLSQADQALYDAKRAGRNTTVVRDPMKSAGEFG